MSGKGLRKFKFERQLGRTFMNPMVSALDRVGIRSAKVVELETTGRKSGAPRRVPLAATTDAKGVWVISQHGHRSGWAHNIEAEPGVRVRVNNQWRSATATFEPHDDVVARGRTFGSATAVALKAMQSDPISVRLTFTD
jgi:deazaflavin-dependent oxidoreductase (nitroreductase family)